MNYLERKWIEINVEKITKESGVAVVKLIVTKIFLHSCLIIFLISDNQRNLFSQTKLSRVNIK